MSRLRTNDELDPIVLRLRGGSVGPRTRLNDVVKVGPWPERLVLPHQLTAEVLDLAECDGLTELPRGLTAYELVLRRTKLRTLPDDLRVETALDLSECRELVELPENLTTGSLVLRGCSSLTALPEGLDVWFLDLGGCWAFSRWPRRATIRSGRLNLRGCAALTRLPDYLGPLATLNVRDCPNLRELPAGLRVTGWIDIAQSGLAQAKQRPESLRGTTIRWQGVVIDERLWLQPESITIREILAETNAERRRVLIDRFGQSRFMEEARAEVLDQDRDPGGPRRLLRVPLDGDEPMVTLSCRCPSTGRQYFLRVPPGTQTCHQAAAWIAGFDDPRDYRPVIET